MKALALIVSLAALIGFATAQACPYSQSKQTITKLYDGKQGQGQTLVVEPQPLIVDTKQPVIDQAN